jgi:hypothetical protein
MASVLSENFIEYADSQCDSHIPESALTEKQNFTQSIAYIVNLCSKKENLKYLLDLLEKQDYRLHPKIDEFISAINKSFEIKHFFPLYKFNPYIDALRECALKYFNAENILFYSQAKFYYPPELLSHLKNTITDLTAKISHKEFVTAINNIRRSSSKNLKSIHEYTESLIQYYSKLLVLRVDFAFQDGSRVTRFDAKEYMIELIKVLKKKFGDKWCGYAWKLEYGFHKKYHIHALIFLNGQKLIDDVKYAHECGEQWKITTKGKGYFFNCNLNKNQYKNIGIGLLDHRNHKMKKTLLEYVTTYLTKIDYFLSLNTPSTEKNFYKGEKKKIANKPKQGRPRKSHLKVTRNIRYERKRRLR